MFRVPGGAGADLGVEWIQAARGDSHQHLTARRLGARQFGKFDPAARRAGATQSSRVVRQPVRRDTAKMPPSGHRSVATQPPPRRTTNSSSRGLSPEHFHHT
jgi:hypothetical protein